VLSIDENDRQAIDALERLYNPSRAVRPLKDVTPEGELATTPDEKKEMLFVPRAGVRRELKDATARSETYQSILDLDQRCDGHSGTRSPVTSRRPLV